MFQQRIDNLRKTLRENNLEALLISNFFNILYLSGFKTLSENEREAWLLITMNSFYLFTDQRYLDQKSIIKDQSSNSNIKYKIIKPEKGLIKLLEEIFTEETIKTCGVEGEDLKILEFKRFIHYFKNIKFFPTEQLIIKHREVKYVEEIEKIRKACEITDQCLKETLQLIEAGKTEKEIAFKIELWLKEKGYDLAFYPIVAIDENSSVIHYDTRNGNNKKVKKNSMILIDFGAKYKDYLSDITRMVFVGQPNDEKIKIYNSLKALQQSVLRSRGVIRVGTRLKNIDNYCRKLLIKNNLPNYPHSTGHGVGLEIHEYPKISPVSGDSLMSNQIITIEPGIYMPGKWGMRIEDTILIKEKNCEVLTKFPKKLLVL